MQQALAQDRRIFEGLADVFAQEDVGACFGLLGDGNMYWGTSLMERGINMVFVRHEHCAVAAAAAHARVTGQVGVATTTCGPGLTQIMTALSIASRAHIPMVVFAGESSLSKSFHNQYIDQAPLVVATGAAYVPIHSAKRALQAARDAFVKARMERRPVVIGVPMDIQDMYWDAAIGLPAPSSSLMPRVGPVAPNPDDLRHAVGIVESARRIVVMAGRGAVLAGAGQVCRALAEKCGGMLAETLPVRGLFRDDPFSLGIAGGLSRKEPRELFAEADLIIAVGASLAYHNADGGNLWPNAKVLHLDMEPVALRDGRMAATNFLRADARLGVSAIIDAIADRAEPWRSPEIAATLRKSRQHAPYATGMTRSGHDPRDAVSALDELLPDEWFFVNTSGHVSGFATNMPLRSHEHFLTIREFGAIGNGTSFAIGAAAARPGQPIVLMDGDGSFLMHAQELETIRRHRLPILAVVMNDGAYGSEIHKLRDRQMSDAGAVFGPTDLAGIARGFGIAGHRVDDLADLPDIIGAFERSSAPMLLDIPISDKIRFRKGM